MMKKETIVNSLLHYRFAPIPKKINKQRLAIMGLWFLILSGIRILLAYVLKDIWIGTFGAVGLTFAVLYLLMKYTPLERYRLKVNVILFQWYRRKYFVVSTITICTILVSLLILIQFGYSYYASKLVSINVFELKDKDLEKGLLPYRNYPFVDKIAIIVASIDRSLNGNYSKTTSFLLAEDMEMTIFVIMARRKRNLFAI